MGVARLTDLPVRREPRLSKRKPRRTACRDVAQGSTTENPRGTWRHVDFDGNDGAPLLQAFPMFPDAFGDRNGSTIPELKVAGCDALQD